MIEFLLYVFFVLLLIVWNNTGRGAKRVPKYSIAVSPAKEGEGPVFRHRFAKDGLFTIADDLSTLHDILKYAQEHYPNNPCVGYRPLERVITQEKVVNGEKRLWTFYQLGPYKWITYGEYITRVENFASGLMALGLKPKSKLAIYEETRIEWVIAAQGAFRQSLSILTVYANLGDEALAYSLKLGKIEVIVTNAANFASLIRICNDVATIKTIIYIGDAEASAKEELENKGIKLLKFDEVEELGKQNPAAEVPPSPDDVAAYMFTSGTTGMPKGIQLTHAGMVSAILATKTLIQEAGVFQSDVYLSYLPMAHVLAFIAHFAAFNLGVRAGFGSVRTLVDSSVKNCQGDLKELKPTVFLAVPAIFERIKKTIEMKIDKMPKFKKAIFKTAYVIKSSIVESGHDSWLLDRLVFDKLKAEIGGNIRFFLCGGSLLSPDVCKFIQTCFAPILQGYGLTETYGPASLQEMSDTRIGSVGAPLPSVEIKLVDVPEMGYTSKDKPYPRGEVWIRGNSVTLGYYENPEETSKAFVDGWFRTGDIGMWHSDGTLTIIDRIKNLIKPSHGEYISIEKLEAVYRENPLVEQLLVYADPSHYDCTAIVVPDEKKLLQWAKERGFDSYSYEKLLNEPATKAFVLKSLQATARNAGLKSIEVIRGVLLTPIKWTPENGMLTAANKLIRRAIIKEFSKQITQMYREIERQ